MHKKMPKCPSKYPEELFFLKVGPADPAPVPFFKTESKTWGRGIISYTTSSL